MVLYAFDNMANTYSKTKMNKLDLGTYINHNKLKELGFEWNGAYWMIDSIDESTINSLNKLGIGVEEPVVEKDFVEKAIKEFKEQNELNLFGFQVRFKSQVNEEWKSKHEFMPYVEAKAIYEALQKKKNARSLYRKLRLKSCINNMDNATLIKYMKESKYTDEEIEQARLYYIRN